MKSKSRLGSTVACLAIMGGGAIGLTVSAQLPAAAQAPADTTKSQQPVTLNFQQGDIQAVLKALFTDVGANYSIDSDVHGTVSISMTNVGFLAALRSVLRANNPPLTFDYTDGVYHIRVRQQEHAVPVTPDVQTTDNTTPGSDNTDTSSSDGNYRWYKISVDNYDVIQMAGFISTMGKPGSYVVKVSGSTGSGGSAGGATSGGVGVMSGGGGISSGMSSAGGVGGGFH